MPDRDLAALLGAYDAQLRAHVHHPLPESVQVERDGPLLRTLGFAGRGMVEYRDLAGLDASELDELIARQVRIFAERGERFEWKLHGHDLPADLPERLRAAGFVPEETETVVIAPVSALATGVTVPDGVALREVSDRADLGRIAELEQAVWGDEHGWIVDSLADERAADPEGLRIFVAEAGDLVVSAGWVRFPSGTEFATLWGGATLPAWRGRSVYARSSRTGRSWPRSAAAATSRWTPRTTAAPSSSASGSSR